MGSEWQDDALASCLVSWFATVSIAGFACSSAILVPLQKDVLYLFCYVTYVSYCALIRSVVDLRACPLLANRLPEMAVARWRYDNKRMWLVATAAIFLRVVRTAVYYGMVALDLKDVSMWKYFAHQVVWVVMYMLVLEVAALTTRILSAVEHRILLVQDALPCKAADFFEKVHKPCAELVDEVGPQLTHLRLAPVFLAAPVLYAGLYVYIELKIIMVSPIIKWNTILTCVSAFIEATALALTLVAGPFRISAALGDLIELLNKVRHNAPELHTEVQAVESILERTNGGQGFGIKVCEGVVLNRQFLQKVCFRMALLSTAVVALLDSKCGFEKVEAQDDSIDNLEANMTSILHLLTNNKTYFHKRE